MDVYYIEDAIAKVKNEIGKEKMLLAAWQGITFNTKKNGEPFANMTKNLNGADYGLKTYATYTYEKELWVNARYGSEYLSDSFNCYEFIRYMKKDDPRLAKTQNITPDNEIYQYDIDDIKNKIVNQIERLSKSIADLESQLERTETAYDVFTTEYKESLAKLKRTLNPKNETWVYSMIRDLVQYRNR